MKDRIRQILINCGMTDTEQLNEAVKELSSTDSTPLTFGELEVGDKFVDFPTDGDDSGHGGFRSGAYVFQKTSDKEPPESGVFDNAFRFFDGNRSYFPDSMQVYKVIL